MSELRNPILSAFLNGRDDARDGIEFDKDASPEWKRGWKSYHGEPKEDRNPAYDGPMGVLTDYEGPDNPNVK